MEPVRDEREQGPAGISRRAFIKGVIAAGGAVSASSYLFRGGQAVAAASAPGAV